MMIEVKKSAESSKLGTMAKLLAGVATAAFVLLINPAAGSPAGLAGSPASPYYAFDVIEQGGSLGQGPSINNRGEVAFVNHTA